MAAKLKHLKVKKVDFVDTGANPESHIKLLKKKDMIQIPEDNVENSGIWKRIISFIAKAMGMKQDEIDSTITEIQKGDSESFNEKYKETQNRKIADEIWDICFALQSSFCSILNDDELDSTTVSTAMQESLKEFSEVVLESIKQWANGKETSIVRKTEEVTKTELEFMKSARERLAESIEKVTSEEQKKSEKNKDELKGENGMKIDKSKLTDAERDFLESIEKRCGTSEAGTEENQTAASAVPEVQNSAPSVAKTAATTTENPQQEITENEDIYKGLHPAVKAELEQLKKFREVAEDKELREVAKRYDIIGKKEDDLIPILKSLKAVGGTAYDDMIAVLDQTVVTVEKSGAFGEIGKLGHEASNESSTVAKIAGIAKSYMEKEQTLDYQTAVAKAWEDNPELIMQYEIEENF